MKRPKERNRQAELVAQTRCAVDMARRLLDQIAGSSDYPPHDLVIAADLLEEAAYRLRSPEVIHDEA